MESSYVSADWTILHFRSTHQQIEWGLVYSFNHQLLLLGAQTAVEYMTPYL